MDGTSAAFGLGSDADWCPCVQAGSGPACGFYSDPATLNLPSPRPPLEGVTQLTVLQERGLGCLWV